MAITETDALKRHVARKFPHPWAVAPESCGKCQKWARQRAQAKGPLAGTVVTDMNVLIRRHADRGHQ